MIDISIIIPTFNRANSVINAIESCISEGKLTLEIIVIDDGSSDNTASTIQQKYLDYHIVEQSTGFSLHSDYTSIKYIFQANSGAPAARNNGLSQAKGKYIKFLDSDDQLIEGAIQKEFETAETLASEALLTAWTICTLDATHKPIDKTVIPAPDLSCGIDDMLDGKGPCASAGLYLRSRIKHLQWDETITKAQDWMWAWTVCLDKIRFDSLNIPSSRYIQHDNDIRITQHGNAMVRSTNARLTILNIVEQRLRETNQLSIQRAKKLAQYYYKDARILCEHNQLEWLRLSARIKRLAPDYIVEEPNRLIQLFIRVLGLHKGIKFFVYLKIIVRKFRF